MTNRRELIKGLSLLSAGAILPANSRLSANAQVEDGSNNGTLNVLLHGLLFMRQGSKNGQPTLEIFAPPIDGHYLHAGVRGNLLDITKAQIDWTDYLPQGKSSRFPDNLPRSLPKFSKEKAQVGEIRTHHGKITLPWPSRFFSIRPGPVPAFYRRGGGKPSNVGDSINALCKPQNGGDVVLGLTTVLVYEKAWPFPEKVRADWIPTLNCHLHFEPPKKPTPSEVNKHLELAAQTFEHPEEFDLAIVEKEYPDYPLQKSGLPPGVSWEDELAEVEQNALLSILLGSFGNTPGHKGSKLREDPLVNTANCPTMYVGPP